MEENPWARLLAYVTGLINQELLLANEYLTRLRLRPTRCTACPQRSG